MKSGVWVKLLLVFLLGSVLLTLCVGSAVAWWLVSRISSGEQGTADRDTSSRIAVVGSDGNVWLTTPDRQEITSVTTDGRGYAFPAWSFDGQQIAFIGPGGTGRPALYSYNLAREEISVLFSDSESAPFYIYWSPDNRSVTFLTQEPSTMSMRVADVDDPGTGRVMARGNPFYWVWSPEGNQLFMHVGGSRAFSPEAHLSLLENREGAHRVELKMAPGVFQAPQWSASGQHIFYIAADESGQEAIYKTDMETSVQTLITPLQESAIMILSPDDQHIAFLETSAAQFPAFGTATIIDTAGQNARQVLNNRVLAMYWSPDGQKLALLTLSLAEEDPIARTAGLAALSFQFEGLRWWIFDLQTDKLELLTSFVPTSDFMQTVPFFDQYYLSLSFWSPDSRYFLVTKGEVGSQAGTVWILDTTRREEPRRIGNGVFAVWSWR